MKFTKYKSATLVAVQFGLIILIATYCGVFGSLISIIVMLVGLLLGIWAVVTMRLKVNILPDVRPGQQLFVNGPYRYIRHPMYTAVLTIAGAWVISRPDIISIGLWFLLLIDLVIKLSYEEKMLTNQFVAYKKYARHTKKLVPFIY